MENGYFWLIVAEICIILLVVILRLIFKYIENRHIHKVLQYFDKDKKAKDEEFRKKFEECLDIIKQNN